MGIEQNVTGVVQNLVGIAFCSKLRGRAKLRGHWLSVVGIVQNVVGIGQISWALCKILWALCKIWACCALGFEGLGSTGFGLYGFGPTGPWALRNRTFWA